jgi:membrane associated rhomboid family serine protease
MLPVRDHLPTRIVPVVNYALVAANIAVFVDELATSAPGAGSESIVARWALVPAALAAHPAQFAPTLLTHMFLHASWMHVGGNMLFLWIFGDNVEDALGHARYLLFYLACGVAAAFAEVAMSVHSTVPMLGASGAIAGVLAGYGLLYPRSPITIVNPIPLLWLFWGLFLLVPAWVVILGFFLVNLWNAFQTTSGEGGVAFMAHVGGFVAGLLLLPLLRARPPVAHETWNRWLGPRRGSVV